MASRKFCFTLLSWNISIEIQRNRWHHWLFNSYRKNQIRFRTAKLAVVYNYDSNRSRLVVVTNALTSGLLFRAPHSIPVRRRLWSVVFDSISASIIQTTHRLDFRTVKRQAWPPLDLTIYFSLPLFRQVRWHCWLGNMKGIRPVKKFRTNNPKGFSLRDLW